jgi:putative transposase
VYDFIKLASVDFEVVDLCEIFSVSRTAFYRYLRGESYRLTAKEEKEQIAVEEVFLEHKRRYGARRIVAELSNRGVKIGRGSFLDEKSRFESDTA